MDNQTYIRELLREIGELEMLIAKSAQYDVTQGMCGLGMLKRLLRRRRHALWSYQQGGSSGAH